MKKISTLITVLATCAITAAAQSSFTTIPALLFVVLIENDSYLKALT
jgi:hypothetical protein